jgi:hypothetical protein
MTVPRKLAAILAVDVAGHLIGADEVGAIENLRRTAPAVSSHWGG